MTQAPDFPVIVNIEVWRGSCPCACRHCPVGRTPRRDRQARFGRGRVSLDLLERIAEQVAGHPGSTLRLHSVGDLILWPLLPEALARIAPHGARTWVFTSAVTRQRDRLEALGRWCDIVEVSINSTTRQDYLATKGVDAFDRVVGNLGVIRAAGRPGLRLLVSRVESGDEAADRDFVEFWRGRAPVDDAFVRSFHVYNGLLEGGDAEDVGSGPRPCLVHWARFNIGHDGRAVVCFNELFRPEIAPDLILGDLHRESIRDLWLGPRLEAIREASLAGDFDRLDGGEAFPCRECAFCQPLFGSNQTSEHQIRELARSTEVRSS